MIGDPEKPGPTPVASTAGPDTRTSSRAPPAAGSSAITSSTSALNEEMSVPCTTESAVQTIPARTLQSTLAEFQETKSEQPFALQNSKLLKVSLREITIQAKAGAMVAYQGEVSFEHAGSGGMSRMLK